MILVISCVTGDILVKSSENLLEASWRALVDSIVYKLSKDDAAAVEAVP